MCDVVPPPRSSSPLRCALSSSRNWLGGQLVGKANGGLPQLARGRKAGFAIDMLQQLEADIAHIEHPLL